MLARVKSVYYLVLLLAFSFRINAGCKFVHYHSSFSGFAIACASGWSWVKFLEVCLTVDGVDALCAVGSALSGLWKVLYYVWVELNIMANTWQQVDTHSSRISRLTFTDHLTS
jgi:hypothetical protein